MGIPTVKAVILRQHIKQDGSVNVKLRVTHNRVVKYLPTTEIARKGDYYQSNLRFKSTGLIKRTADLVERIQDVIAEIDAFEWSSRTTAEVCDYVSKSLAAKEKFTLDFFGFGYEWAGKKKKYSGNNYRTALKSFSTFLGKEAMDISEITSTLMRRYEAYLHEKHGKDARAVSLYTSSIAAIHAQARRLYNDDELGNTRIRNPFEYYKPPKQKPAEKSAIPKETIQDLIDIRNSLPYYHKLAVDVFLLSFCLMGTNVPDLYDAEREKDIILYNRTKTRERRSDHAEMKIRLEPVCGCIFEDMKDSSGKKAFKLHTLYTFYKSIADKANDRLKDVAKMIGAKPFSMKAARSTWATVAYAIGINEGIVNDCLCHVDQDMAVTDIYIKKDWSVLWEANRKVLEQFNWE